MGRNGCIRLILLSVIFFSPYRSQSIFFRATRSPYCHHCKTITPFCFRFTEGCMETATSCFHSVCSGGGSGEKCEQLISRLFIALAPGLDTMLVAPHQYHVAQHRWGERIMENQLHQVEIPSPSNRQAQRRTEIGLESF